MKKVEFENEALWLEARKKCLTGTQVAEKIGIKSPYKQKTREEMAKSPAVIFGKNCESSVLKIFANLPQINKNTLVIPTLKPTLWYSDFDERIAGSFDALAYEGSTEGFCECKCTSGDFYDLKNWIIPETTWLQIIHYFCVNPKFEFCYLVVCKYHLWGNFSTKIDWVRIDRKDISKQISNLTQWHSYLLRKE